MKILIINPNSDSNTDRIMAEKAKKLALPEVEVVIFRERQTSIPLDEVGSPEIRAYGADIAKTYLHRK